MTLLAPTLKSLDVLVEYSQSVKLDKNVFVTVPSDYTAYFASNEAYVAKLSNCKEENLLRIVGKDFKGDDVRVAFIRNIQLPLEPWGFGGLRVINEKLNTAYTVGCNGKYQLQITNPNRLLRAFSNNASVTLKMVKEKTKPLLEPVARPILSKYFVEKQLSIYEIESKLDEIRTLLSKALTKEDLFKDMGLKIKEITINGIYVPEGEAEVVNVPVRERPQSEVKDEEFEYIRKEIEVLKEAIQDTKDSDTIIDEIDNLKRELIELLERRERDQYLKLQEELQQIKDKINKEDE